MAHGRDRPTTQAVRIAVAAMAASVGLDLERSTLYVDLVAASLSAAARKALQSMDPSTYEYQSTFAKRYFKQGLRKGAAAGEVKWRAKGRAEGRAEGRVEGRVEGRAELVLKQLAIRFGALPKRAEARVRKASLAELDVVAERLLTAATLKEALQACGNHK